MTFSFPGEDATDRFVYLLTAMDQCIILCFAGRRDNQPWAGL